METRKVKDFNDIKGLTKEEAKAILINTLDTRFDDNQDDDVTGWTLDFENIKDEDLLDDFVYFASDNKIDAEDLICKTVEEENFRGEFGDYTRHYIYFVRKSSAEALVESLKKQIKAF